MCVNRTAVYWPEMVRKYKRKGVKYGEDVLQAPCRAVINDGISLRDAEKMYNTPRSTISNRLCQGDEEPKSRGRRNVFSAETEKQLADCLNIMAKWGFSLGK